MRKQTLKERVSQVLRLETGLKKKIGGRLLTQVKNAEKNKMSKDPILIKSNGIRNELKEIRKSIDKLTNALINIHNAQTNNHGKKNNTITNSSHND